MNRHLPTFVVFFVAAVIFVTMQVAAQKQPDGPVSVSLGDVFERGTTRIEDADLAKLPAMPRGYVALNSKSYRITTKATATGPYRVNFKISSIADEETFKNLRIFHAEPEPFDPDALIWVDRTASQPDADFSTKTINAESDDLEPGFYVIGRMVEKIAPSTAVADLEIVAKGTPELVQVPNNMTFSVTVKNNGPDVATDVGMVERLTSGELISATASHGSCKGKPGRVFCKLGQLAVGGVATITVVIKPYSDFAGHYDSYFSTAGQEKDSNSENNESMESVLANPDPNDAPEITLEGSLEEQVLDPGAIVTLKATATDANGSITKVEFYDNIQLLGIGSTSDAKHFSFTTGELANGWHVFSAIATDNSGREREGRPVKFFVNGPTKVRVVEPKVGTQLKSGSDLAIAIEAINPAGIKSVEIFVNGVSCGHATSAGDNRYVLKVKYVPGVDYRIGAFVIDNAGSASKTHEFNFRVSK